MSLATHLLPSARMLRALALMTLAFAGIASAYAQTDTSPNSRAEGWWRNAQGKPAKETPGMKSNKGFSAMLVLAEKSEAERFVREWNETATEHAPTIDPAESAERGQSIVLMLLYAGCSAKPEGPAPCTATIDIKTTDPNGKVVLEQLDVMLARTLPAYPEIVQLSPITLQTDFEPNDPVGPYRYDVVVRNPERNATIDLTESIVLTPQASARPATP